MKFHVSLFDGRLTRAQQLIVLLWSLLLAGVIGLWAMGSLSLLAAGMPSVLLAVGRLAGMLATFFALTQFMLMGRIGWIERAFGLDRLAAYHRLNGYAAIILILLHPFLIVGSYALASGTNYVAQYFATLSGHPYAWLALIAEILFVAVVISSIYLARRRLTFEWWYGVHLLVYLAIVIVPFHQLASGTSLSLSPFAAGVWLTMYGFVALNLLAWRFVLPVADLFRFQFRVVKVQPETPTVTSIYIHGRGLHRFKARAGQFVLVRFLTKEFGAQEHPFSLSMVPTEDQLRLTVRAVGSYTTALRQLKPGTPVVVSGPFGRFTRQVAVTNKRLFIAGGIGITPIRTLLEEAAGTNNDSVLLYANKTSRDVPLKKELDALKNQTTYVTYVYDEVVGGAEHGHINGALVARLVPDFRERDVYICGPPAMMATIIHELTHAAVPPEQIHYERFAFLTG